MKRIRVIALLSVCIAAGASLAPPRPAAAASRALIDYFSDKYEPAYRWRSLKTQHFWIHYHRELEPAARRLAVIAERVHERLSRDLQWTPMLRTDVVLVDKSDSPNGMATPFPYNRIVLYMTPPFPDSELHNYDDWIELVFVHEYTHILNMDSVRGAPRAFQFILGRLIFPNSFVPVWALEGNAVYHESRKGVFGRNNSARWEMMLRTDVLEGAFRPIDQASTFPRDWPGSRVPYLYGGFFVKWLEETYGQDTMAKYFEDNSHNLIPFWDNLAPGRLFFNRKAKKIFGKSFHQLWRDWQRAVTEKYARETKTLIAAGLTAGEQVSPAGYDALFPRFAPDGESLYFVQSSSRTGSYLIRQRIGEKKGINVCRVNDPTWLTIASTGEVMLTDFELWRSYSYYSEAFTPGLTYRRLTANLRGHFVGLSRDGERSVFVRHRPGAYELVIADRRLENRRTILGPTAIQISFPAFSPDGMRVAFTLRGRDGRTDLAVIDVATGAVTRLTADAANDIEPAWHPDGRTIVFSSDRSGVHNLWTIDTASGVMSRITNLTGGAFSPDVSPDGARVAFSSYHHYGHAATVMPWPAVPLQKQTVKPAPLAASFFAKSDETPAPADDAAQPRRYNPLRSVFPSSWYPVFYTDELASCRYDATLGVTMSGADTLFHHVYDVSAACAIVQRRATVSASYTYARFYPNFTAGYYDSNLFLGRDPFPWGETTTAYHRETSREAYGGLEVPVNSFRTTQLIGLYYSYQRLFIAEYRPILDAYSMTGYEYYYYYPQRLPFFNTIRRRHNMAHATLAYRLSHTHRYAYSISDEQGRELDLTMRYYHRALGSERTFWRASGRYAEYLPSFLPNHVIMLEARGGATFGAPTYYAPYYLGRFGSGLTTDPPVGEDAWGLRGYPVSARWGGRMAAATLEYRCPLFQRDAGPITVPVSFRDLWLAVFIETGAVWDGNFSTGLLRPAAGLELHLNLRFGYVMTLDGFAGYAFGFGGGGEHQVYFGVKGCVEGRLRQRN